MTTVRVRLPTHLRTLAGVDGAVALEVDGPVTIRAVMRALEADFPALRGTVWDAATGERRDLMRFYAAGRDLSHEPVDAVLPEDVARGEEAFLVVGAIAGGRT